MFFTMAERTCFFVSDLHGRIDRYRKLFRAVALERPRGLLWRRSPGQQTARRSLLTSQQQSRCP
jgi:hypothetical protein